MSLWFSVLPQLAWAVALVVVPGLAVGWGLRLRREWLLGLAPLLSFAVLSVAVYVSTMLQVGWGVLPVLAVTLALTVGGWLLTRLSPLRAALPDSPEPDGPRSAFLLAGTALSSLVTALVVMRGMHSPQHPHQSFDAPFHVNAMTHIAAVGQAGPSVVGGTIVHGRSTGSFYPPTFEALGALVLGAGGHDAVVAANIAALVVAAVAFPLSMMLLIRVLAPRSRTAWAVALAATTAQCAFPYLLLAFGVVWPVAMGVSVTPAALALVWVAAKGLGRWPRGGRAVVIRDVLVLALGMVGLAYVHPGAVFMIAFLSLPIATWLVVRWCSRLWRGRRSGLAVALGVAAVLALVVGWRVATGLKAVASLRKTDWPAIESIPQAALEVLSLAPVSRANPIAPSGYATGGLALLVVLGLVHLLWRRSGVVWIAASHAIVGVLYVLAAAVDSPLSQLVTGFWYNDRYRVVALLGVTSPILAAWGAGLVLRVARALLGRLGVRGTSAPDTRSGRLVPVGVLVLALVLIPLPAAWGRAVQLLNVGYDGMADRVLTTPREVAVYRQIPRGPVEDTVIGSPFSGAVVAGPMTGHSSVFAHLRVVMDADRRLLAERFRDYQSDPQVCRAVQRLRVRYAAEDEGYFDRPIEERSRSGYRGVVGLRGAPGLTVLAADGPTTVYEVAPCRT